MIYGVKSRVNYSRFVKIIDTVSELIQLEYAQSMINL